MTRTGINDSNTLQCRRINNRKEYTCDRFVCAGIFATHQRRTNLSISWKNVCQSLREKCEASLVNCVLNTVSVVQQFRWGEHWGAFTTFRDCWGFVWRQEIDQYSPDLGCNISCHNLQPPDKVLSYLHSTPSVTGLGITLLLVAAIPPTNTLSTFIVYLGPYIPT